MSDTGRSRAEVREWHADEGWGVVDAPALPGGCWLHYSQLHMPGYRTLTAGQRVDVDWETADQDGFRFRAVRVTPLPR